MLNIKCFPTGDLNDRLYFFDAVTNYVLSFGTVFKYMDLEFSEYINGYFSYTFR